MAGPMTVGGGTAAGGEVAQATLVVQGIKLKILLQMTVSNMGPGQGRLWGVTMRQLCPTVPLNNIPESQ